MSVRPPADLKLPPTPRSSPCSAGRPRARALQRQGCGQCFEQNQGGPVLAALLGTPCPGVAALASDSSRPARHSSGLSSVPTAAPAQLGPCAGDGAKASGGPSCKPLPHSDPCWSERKLFWGEPRKQGQIRPIPWGRNGQGGTCLAGWRLGGFRTSPGVEHKGGPPTCSGAARVRSPSLRPGAEGLLAHALGAALAHMLSEGRGPRRSPLHLAENQGDRQETGGDRLCWPRGARVFQAADRPHLCQEARVPQLSPSHT